MTRLAALALLTASLPPLAFTPDDCTHSTYDHTGAIPPGYQPGSDTFTPCGSTSATVHVSISASGEVHVVGADAEGSLAITIQSPSQCPNQRLHYSGEIIGCKDSGTLHCWNCDPQGDQVRVKLYGNPSPCPSLPPANLSAILNAAGDAVSSGLPITIPCDELKDVTEEQLDESSWTRYTARTNRCEPCEDGEPYPERELAGQYLTVGDAVLFMHQGKLSQLDLQLLMAGAVPLAEFGAVTVPPELAAHLGADAPATLPEELRLARESLGAIEGLDGFVCEIATSYAAGLPGAAGPVERTLSAYGKLRANGDYSIRLPESLSLSDGRRASFTEHWLGSAGDVYCAEEGELSGVIYPGANRSAEIPRSTRLWFLRDLQSWLVDPLRLSTSPAMRYTTEEISATRLRVTQSLTWSYAAGVQPSPEALLLFGGSTEYLLDLAPHVPRVLAFTRLRPDGTRTEVQLQRWSELAEGVQRPTLVTVTRHHQDGSLDRATTYRMTSVGTIADTAAQLDWPAPTDDVWYVRVE